MPKYFNFTVNGYTLYFTSKCIVEAMHAHASDSKLTERGSAKFWVFPGGGSRLQNRGALSNKDIADIQRFIVNNYEKMFEVWKEYCDRAGEPVTFMNK